MRIILELIGWKWIFGFNGSHQYGNHESRGPCWWDTSFIDNDRLIDTKVNIAFI